MIDVATADARSSVNVVRGFNPYVHGARGLFAFMIFVFHVVNSRLPTLPSLSQSWPLFMLRSLEHGVELFFGISGIVIVGALSRARGPLVFAIERATRIYPVLWVSIVVIAALSGLTGFEGRGLPTPLTLIANLLALPPVFPGPLIHPAAWSLSYELTFYGFCALAWVLRRRIGPWALPLIVAAAALLLATHIRAVLMVTGMAAAVTLARHPGWAKYARAPGIWLLLFLAAWETVCQSNGGELISVRLIDLSPVSVLIAAGAVVAATLSLAGVLAGQGLLSVGLRSAPLQFMGSISYSFYLWHPIVMSIVKHFMYVTHIVDRAGPFSQAAFFALALPPSLILAWISQITLEKRVTTWLRRRLESWAGARKIVHPPTTTTHPGLDTPQP
jgi:peptidoglycan/LPS O-acetylase OafA/YrhL